MILRQDIFDNYFRHRRTKDDEQCVLPAWCPLSPGRDLQFDRLSSADPFLSRVGSGLLEQCQRSMLCMGAGWVLSLAEAI